MVTVPRARKKNNPRDTENTEKTIEGEFSKPNLCVLRVSGVQFLCPGRLSVMLPFDHADPIRPVAPF